jgi:uncharacterized protein (DUF111 family)
MSSAPCSATWNKTMETPPGFETDTVVRLETNLDDLSPEVTGAVLEKLLARGALDAWLTAVQMKKNRPGVQLTILCEEEAIGPLVEIVLTETSAFGLRVDRVQRIKLERRFETVQTEFGEVSIKLGLKGGVVVQIAPEFESCRELSQRSSRPLREIYDAARAAFAGMRARS